MKRTVTNIRYGDINWPIEDKNKYREFKDCEECLEWGNKHYLKWSKKYKEVMCLVKKIKHNSSLVTSVVECYCGYSYQQINEYLRYGEHKDKETSYGELANILTMVLCSAPKIPEDIILYRVVKEDVVKNLIAKNRERFSVPFQEKGFMSTSMRKNIY